MIGTLNPEPIYVHIEYNLGFVLVGSELHVVLMLGSHRYPQADVSSVERERRDAANHKRNVRRKAQRAAARNATLQ